MSIIYAKAQKAIREHFEERMDEKTRRLVDVLEQDLYNGPLVGEDAEACYGIEGSPYEKGLRKLESWCEDHLQEVWYDPQSECVFDKAPKPEVWVDEDGFEREVPLDDYVAFSREDVANILFEELIRHGGMCP